MSRMGGDAGKNIGQPDLRIDSVHLGRDDQAVHGRGTPSAPIRSAKQPGFSAKSHHPTILPISGGKSRSITDGIRCFAVTFVGITASNALRANWSTSRSREVR
jgi:hypothetical protein